MKLIYTHENKIIVENARNCLREAGIEAVLTNEYAAGGIGELSPIETWPELWVNQRDVLRAEPIVSALLSQVDGDPWHCTQCHEENSASFDLCWNCQSSKA